MAAAAGGNAFEEYGGIDPAMDPELAMAIRVITNLSYCPNRLSLLFLYCLGIFGRVESARSPGGDSRAEHE